MSKNVSHLFLNSVHCDWNKAMKGKKALALYFSAHWCPPCRGFTPQLAKWYSQDSIWDDVDRTLIFLLSSHIQHFLGPQSSWRVFLLGCFGGSESERLGSGICIFRSWWSILQGILWRDALVSLGLFWSEVEGGSPRACSGVFVFSCKEITILICRHIYIYISICQKLQIGFSCNRLRFYFFQQALLGTISTDGSILRQEQLSSAFKVQGIPSLDTWPRGKGQWWRWEEVEISFKVGAVGVIKWWKLLGGLTEKWICQKKLFKLDMEVEDSTGTSLRHRFILSNNLNLGLYTKTFRSKLTRV